MKRNNKGKIKHSLGDRTFDVINIIVFALFALMCTYPIYYVIINTFSDNALVTAGRVRLWPQGFHFQNYLDVFKLKGIGAAAITSIARTVIGTAVGVSSALIVGYTISKKEFWHRKFWYRFMVITMYFSAGLIPTYMNHVNLGLVNNFMVYVIPNFIVPYHMILVKTYMESLPESLEEAAYIDGAGYFVRFTRLVVPLCKPIAATIAIYVAVAEWNSYMDTLMYMRGGKFQTLQSVLYRYLNQSNTIAEMVKSGAIVDENVLSTITPTSIKYTVTAITIIPILFVYPFFQRHFAKGLMIGAVKG